MSFCRLHQASWAHFLDSDRVSSYSGHPGSYLDVYHSLNIDTCVSLYYSRHPL
jgi:hypothetical protein